MHAPDLRLTNEVISRMQGQLDPGGCFQHTVNLLISEPFGLTAKLC